jgi:hypothetical protein
VKKLLASAPDSCYNTGMDPKVQYCAKKHYSAALCQYWIDNPGCEVCGRVSEVPHHIRTRGAGGTDDHTNLLALCILHHRQVHDAGADTFAARYPKLAGKIRRARERSKI